MQQEPSLIERIWRVALAFLGTVGIIIAVNKVGLTVDPIVEHLLLVLAAMFGVHLLERAWLWRDIAAWNRQTLQGVLESANQLVNASERCGLIEIYPERKEVREKVYESIRLAQKRVWLLGTSFSEEVELRKLLRSYEENLDSRAQTKNDAELDFRVLLMDCLSTAAMFRSFLENDLKYVRDIVSINESIQARAATYFSKRAYRAYEADYKIFDVDFYKGKVKFYKSTPPCWLVIVDNIAYYEPYTLARPEKHATFDPCPGASMPVFKVQKQRGKKWFKIAVSHFETVWNTANTDLLEVDIRNASSDSRVEEFEQIDARQNAWFSYVSRVLRNEEKRAFPRTRLRNPVRVRVIHDSSDEEKPSDVLAEVVECSFGGLLCRGDTAPRNDTVRLSLADPNDRWPGLMLNNMIGSGETRFQVVRPRQHESSVGSQMEFGLRIM